MVNINGLPKDVIQIKNESPIIQDSPVGARLEDAPYIDSKTP